MASLCIANCGRPKLKGRGRKYCATCKEAAAEAKRQDAIRRVAAWRLEHPEEYVTGARRYYAQTAEKQRARARAWYQANPEKVAAHRQRAKERKHPRVHKYGLSLAEYNALLEAQGGRCAICQITHNGKRHNFDIDHDHETGAVRGLLCNRCNRLLSNAQDDVQRLAAAAAYLTKAGKP